MTSGASVSKNPTGVRADRELPGPPSSRPRPLVRAPRFDVVCVARARGTRGAAPAEMTTPTSARTPASTSDALVADLRALIARHGAERFLAGPLVEPTPAFFPDAWSPDDAGVLSLARRVFVLAGLGEVRIELSAVASPTQRLEASVAAIRGDGVTQLHEPDGPATLQSVGEAWCVIGVDPSGPRCHYDHTLR